MIKISDCILSPDSLLIDAIKKIHASRLNIILIVEKEILIGVITDGDIRKSVIKGSPNSDKVIKHMNKDPVVIRSLDLKDAYKISNESKLESIPVVDEDNKLQALFSQHLGSFVNFHDDKEILQKRIDDSVVALIMAGGEGKRLRPYTEKVPKSLATLGDTTLIERNIALLSEAGINQIFISVNYLAKNIIDKLGDGSEYNVDIKYLHETEKLGTAGPISFMKETKFKNLMVINADIVTNIIFSSLVSFHIKNNLSATVACTKNYIPISYGVLEIDDSLTIKNIQEKPIKEIWCSAGIYMFSYLLINEYFNKKEGYLDMPDFINEIREKGEDVRAFPLIPSQEEWFDVANLDDLKEINLKDWIK